MIFQATKIDAATVSYSQLIGLQQGKPLNKNINELDEETLNNIRRYLDAKRSSDYRLIKDLLNKDIFEKHFKFTVVIEHFPTIEEDGSQKMTLRCFKHHQCAAQRLSKKDKKLSGSDEDG